MMGSLGWNAGAMLESDRRSASRPLSKGDDWWTGDGKVQPAMQRVARIKHVIIILMWMSLAPSKELAMPN